MNGIALVIGTIIGSGIFVSPKGVFENAGESIYWALGIWTFCGIFSMMGSLCFSELGTTITRSGGEYAYVLEAFGPLAGFLNLWIQLLVIRPTTQAISSITFAYYVTSPFYNGCEPSALILRLTAASCLCECRELLEDVDRIVSLATRLPNDPLPSSTVSNNRYPNVRELPQRSLVHECPGILYFCQIIGRPGHHRLRFHPYHSGYVQAGVESIVCFEGSFLDCLTVTDRIKAHHSSRRERGKHRHQADCSLHLLGTLCLRRLVSPGQYPCHPFAVCHLSPSSFFCFLITHDLLSPSLSMMV